MSGRGGRAARKGAPRRKARSEAPVLGRLSPYVRLAHEFLAPPSLVVGPRCINDHALLYFRQGTGEFRSGGAKVALAPGTVVFVRPDVRHTLACGPGPVRMLNLHFDLVEHAGAEKISYHRAAAEPNPRRNLETLGTEAGAADYLPGWLQVVATASYERIFQLILHAFSLSGTDGQLRGKAGLIELLALLLRETRARSVSPQLARHLPQLERAGLFMAANLDRPVALGEMARAAGLSRTHFAASFRAFYQQSPARFHLRQRLERAAAGLMAGPQSVKEIAARSGFQTVHHFSRCFAREMGLPPAAYRREHGGG